MPPLGIVTMSCASDLVSFVSQRADGPDRGWSDCIARCCTAIEFVSFVSERAPRNAQGGIRLSAKLRGSGSQWHCVEPSPPFGVTVSSM